MAANHCFCSNSNPWLFQQEVEALSLPVSLGGLCLALTSGRSDVVSVWQEETVQFLFSPLEACHPLRSLKPLLGRATWQAQVPSPSPRRRDLSGAISAGSFSASSQLEADTR